VKGNRARVAAWVAFAAFAVVIFSGVNNSGVAHAQNLGQRNVGGLALTQTPQQSRAPPSSSKKQIL